MHRTFSTPDAISLFVAIGSGNVVLHAAAVDQTEVEITGDGADDVTVEQRGDEVHVTAPPRLGGLFSGRSGLDVHVSLPTGSRVVTKLGSADLTATGELGTVSLKTGSGSVRLESVAGDAEVNTGSGDVTLANPANNITSGMTFNVAGNINVVNSGAFSANCAATGNVTLKANGGWSTTIGCGRRSLQLCLELVNSSLSGSPLLCRLRQLRAQLVALLARRVQFGCGRRLLQLGLELVNSPLSGLELLCRLGQFRAQLVALFALRVELGRGRRLLQLGLELANSPLSGLQLSCRLRQQ